MSPSSVDPRLQLSGPFEGLGGFVRGIGVAEREAEVVAGRGQVRREFDRPVQVRHSLVRPSGATVRLGEVDVESRLLRRSLEGTLVEVDRRRRASRRERSGSDQNERRNVVRLAGQDLSTEHLGFRDPTLVEGFLREPQFLRVGHLRPGTCESPMSRSVRGTIAHLLAPRKRPHRCVRRPGRTRHLRLFTPTLAGANSHLTVRNTSNRTPPRTARGHSLGPRQGSGS
jgi:hypothetical protein